MQPKTLEEALQVIAELSNKNNQLQEKVQTVIDEKKEVLKMFDKDELDGMTDTERKLADALEQSRNENARLAKAMEDDKTAREVAEKERQTKLIDERIQKVAKGDKEFEDKLRANVDLLEKLPRSTDSELDALITSAYNLTGQKSTDPLNTTSNSSGGNPDIVATPGFAETTEGKMLGEKLGIVEPIAPAPVVAPVAPTV